MLGEGEAQELRVLQQRAYGRDGALTEAESERLDVLERARRAVVRPVHAGAPPNAAPPSEPIADHADAAAEPDSSGQDAVQTPDQSLSSDRPETLARSLAHHAPRLLVVAAVLLLAGIAAGWALFAPRPEGIPLTGEQQERRAALQADPEVFDPGSVRAVAQSDVALAWYATQDDGKSRCLVLDVGSQSQTTCLPQDQIRSGLSASLPVPPDTGEEEEDASEVVNASLVLSTTGEPMVTLQRWGMASSILGWFEGAERERAEALVEEGYELGLSLVGRFRGGDVWVADRVAEEGATERCLIVDAEAAVSCSRFETALQEGLGVQVADAGPDGVVSRVVLLELRYTPQQTPYLTITDAPVTEVGSGDTVRVDAPPGDPIVVEPPGRDAER
ncbi:hypothetical protein [Microbacterium sp. NPDC091662]|uniref:hypothetical protein n=1 Tax=Microbacterium sp. NPDC091662 TaxID=3364211 RepID=UPI0037F630D7